MLYKRGPACECMAQRRVAWRTFDLMLPRMLLAAYGCWEGWCFPCRCLLCVCSAHKKRPSEVGCLHERQSPAGHLIVVL